MDKGPWPGSVMIRMHIRGKHRLEMSTLWWKQISIADIYFFVSHWTVVYLYWAVGSSSASCGEVGEFPSDIKIRQSNCWVIQWTIKVFQNVQRLKNVIHCSHSLCWRTWFGGSPLRTGCRKADSCSWNAVGCSFLTKWSTGKTKQQLTYVTLFQSNVNMWGDDH